MQTNLRIIAHRHNTFSTGFRIRNKKRRRGGIRLDELQRLPGVWIAVDVATGCIIDGSDGFDEMVFMDKREYLTKPISMFYVREERGLWSMKSFTEALLVVEGRHEDVLLKGNAPRTVVADVHVSKPIRVGNVRAVICVITDETERHRLQSELINKHKELRKTFTDLECQSKALTVLNAEISEMSAQLSQASSLAAIGEITAELAHQLGNPLAGAVSAARRIDMFLGPETDPRAREMIPLLKTSLERLRTTINELKRVYKNSKSADALMEPMDLKATVDGALMLLHQRLGEIELQMHFPSKPVEILARPAEIQHVLINLIDNAIQAVGDRGVIQLRVRQERGRVMFIVGDNGPGIPTDQWERIFEPFFTTSEHGSGLGLSMVRRNVQNNKAEIRVGRSPLGGAEFEIGFVSAT